MAHVVRGKNIVLTAIKDSEYRPFACATDLVLTVNTELLETSTATTGPYRTFRPVGLSDWDIELGGVLFLRDLAVTKNYALESIIQQVREDGYDIKITFTDEGGFVETFSGFVFIPTTVISKNSASNGRWNIRFKGSGEFELNVSFTPILYDVNTYYYDATGGETDFVDATLIGRIPILGFRSTDEYKIITVGSPGQQELKYVSASGTISWTPDIPAIAGERFTFTYKS